MIDNYPDVTDEYRLRTGPSQLNWDHNPIFHAIRAHFRPDVTDVIDQKMFSLARLHGYTGQELHHFASPLIGPGGWFATIMFASPDPCSRTLERELTMYVAQVSVWCTAQGIAALPTLPPGCRLTPRAYQIARLAARGLTNVEIASRLGISFNTVKVRLKQIFDRFAVDTREELASVMKRLSPLEGVPLGVSSLGKVKLTRASHSVAWVPASAVTEGDELCG